MDDGVDVLEGFVDGTVIEGVRLLLSVGRQERANLSGLAREEKTVTFSSFPRLDQAGSKTLLDASRYTSACALT